MIAGRSSGIVKRNALAGAALLMRVRIPHKVKNLFAFLLHGCSNPACFHAHAPKVLIVRNPGILEVSGLIFSWKIADMGLGANNDSGYPPEQYAHVSQFRPD